MSDKTCPDCGVDLEYLPIRDGTKGGDATVMVPFVAGTKTAHDIVDCLTRQNAQLRAIVEKLPAKAILDCCGLIEDAERRAMAEDGSPVRKTSVALSPIAAEDCLRALWQCREAAEAGQAKGEPPAPSPTDGTREAEGD